MCPEFDGKRKFIGKNLASNVSAKLIGLIMLLTITSLSLKPLANLATSQELVRTCFINFSLAGIGGELARWQGSR